jgi:hypothetical protein
MVHGVAHKSHGMRLVALAPGPSPSDANSKMMPDRAISTNNSAT